MSNGYLCHYGILGMKWGVRRYQNHDGSLTSEGRARYSAGNKFYRIQSTNKSDAKEMPRLYVTATKEDSSKYNYILGLKKVAQNGKAVIAEYKNVKELSIPSVKEQEKIERELLKRPEVREDIIASLNRKRVEHGSPEYTEKELKKVNKWLDYNPKKEALERVAAVPLLLVVPTLYSDITARDKWRMRTLRSTQGDQDAKVFNKANDEAFTSRGYNAYRDLHDITNKKLDVKTPLVILNPNKNLKQSGRRNMTQEDYIDAYKYYNDSFFTKEEKVVAGALEMWKKALEYNEQHP